MADLAQPASSRRHVRHHFGCANVAGSGGLDETLLFARLITVAGEFIIGVEIESWTGQGV